MLIHAARLGFDESKFSFAFRTSLVACVALLLAWLMGLDHPQWAAMSVWAASQPFREQALVKGGFRMLGTFAGTLAGIALVGLSQFSPYAMVLGLAAWVSLCTWASNIQRGFLAYGTVLAGYTAAMVALLGPGTADGVLALGADRLATVLTGVTTATIASLMFAPKGSSGAGLRAELRGLLAEILLDLAQALRGGKDLASTSEIISRIASIDEGLETRFPTMIRTSRSARALLIAAVAVMFQRQNRPETAPEVAEELDRAAVALQAKSPHEAGEALRAAGGAMGAASPGLREALENLADALMAWQPASGALRPIKSLPVILHQDWVGARQAALRAAFALSLVGLTWQLTGWSAGNYILLGLSVMISLFSSFENPARMMRSVLIGQICGVIAVFICRWLVWPHLANEGEMILAMMPFIIVGGLLLVHRRTLLIALDYHLIFLLLMAPSWPLVGTPSATAFAAVGVLSGPILALILYRLIFPTDLSRRIEMLRGMMRRDLAALAAEGDAWNNRNAWRARLYHRSLRLTRMLERARLSREAAIEQSLAGLETGHRLMQLHRLQAQGQLPPQAQRRAEMVLARARHFDTEPAKAQAALTRWFNRYRPSR